MVRTRGRRGTLGPIQHRRRLLDANDLWKLVVLRGLGFSEAEIAQELERPGKNVSQAVVSYHLRRLRKLCVDEQAQYRVLAKLFVSSTTAVPGLMQAVVELAQKRGGR